MYQLNESSDERLKLKVIYPEDFEIIESKDFEENTNEINIDLGTDLDLIKNKLDANKINNEDEEWNFVETCI